MAGFGREARNLDFFYELSQILNLGNQFKDSGPHTHTHICVLGGQVPDVGFPECSALQHVRLCSLIYQLQSHCDDLDISWDLPLEK